MFPANHLPPSGCRACLRRKHRPPRVQSASPRIISWSPLICPSEALASFSPCTVSPTIRRSNISAIAPAGVDTNATGSINDVWTSATISADLRHRPCGADAQNQDAEVGQQTCGPDPSKHRIAQRRENAAGGRRALIRHDANHAGRFGKTGPLDFAIHWNLGASGLFLSAHKFEDMTEPRTYENSKLAFDQPAHRPEIVPPFHSLSEFESDLAEPREDHRVLKLSCRRIAGARERQSARVRVRAREPGVRPRLDS